MLRVSAPAKINLSLHITGKRADGYHLLESLVAFTEFGDALEIAPSDELSLEIVGEFAGGLSGDNLVLRAAKLLQAHADIKSGAKIILHKNIPIGAGLGGGSSDAAAALRGLVQLWDIKISDADLQKIALQLGSDVPVCLLQKPAIIRGIGEEIMRVSLPVGLWLLLVNPNVPLLTAEVYRVYSAEFDVPHNKPIETLVHHLRQTHNALEKPATQLLPVIAEIMELIGETSGCQIARMSGSGATCFGLYESEQAARGAMKLIKQKYPNWWGVVTGLYG